MATDPRKLKPGEACRLLNSTPLGEVLSDRRLREHRTRAGHRVGDGKTIDLIRYAAWLAGERQRQPAAAAVPQGTTAYERHKAAAANRQTQLSAKGRDIGALPAVADSQRRTAAEASFQVFCETYFQERFTLAWSKDHPRIIARIEETAERGGQFAMAMPRGSGKTSLCEVACIWALVTGRRQFVLLIGASAAAAEENLDSIKKELEANELLAADFPEVCVPIQKLEGGANLCARQLCCGERTQMVYGKRVLVLPTVRLDGKLTPASGAILRVVGITGRLRGMKFTRSDGKSVRPDLVVLDDPQTDASAKSEPQCAQRERLIAGAVLGLAGPGCKIAAIMPCTIIRHGDMAANILDRNKHPEWHGEITKLVYKFPTNEKLWEEYRSIQAASLRNGGDGSEATAFYGKNRKAMDAGAEVSWPERFEPGQLSGLQYAMDLKFKDEAAFWAEYQNEPVTDAAEDDLMVDVVTIGAKVNGVKRRIVPLWASRVVAYIDVQHRLLYWVVGAFSDDFSGAVIDYGTWPDQGRSYFNYRGVKKTLQSHYGIKSVEAAVRAGLADCSNMLVDRGWKSEAGSELRIERLLPDAADGNLTDIVFEFCRTSRFAPLIFPAIGKGIGPADKRFDEYKAKEGERIGFHWMLQPSPKRAYRQLILDANFWKSFVHEHLAMPLGERGALSLFGDSRTDHRLFAEHVGASEYCTRIKHEKTARSCKVFKARPGRDNHWFDGLAGCCAAASYQGSSILDKAARSGPRRRVSLSF